MLEKTDDGLENNSNNCGDGVRAVAYLWQEQWKMQEIVIKKSRLLQFYKDWLLIEGLV